MASAFLTIGPYINGSATSKQAAVDISSARDTLRKRVHQYLVDNGPSTDEEIQLGLKMNPSTQRPRRVELVTAGAVRDSVIRRRTQSGRFATVWEVV
jgi:hypothetical protein